MKAAIATLVLTIPLLGCTADPPDEVGTVSEALSPQFVQVAASDPASASSVAVKLGKAQLAGDGNDVAVCWFDATSTIASVSDTKGNRYGVVAPLFRDVTDGASCETFAAFGIAAGTNMVTVKFSGTVNSPDVRVAEYSWISGIDVSAAASGSGTLASSGNATTTVVGDLLVGSNFLENATTGPGSGFTSRVITQPDMDILEDRVVGAPGPYSATAPTNGGWWLMQMAAFKPSGSGSADGGSDAGRGGVDAGGGDGEAGGAQQADGGLEASADGGSDGSPDAGPNGGDAADAGELLDASGDGGGGDSAPPGDSGVVAALALVQHVSGSNLRANSMAAPYCYYLYLPAPSQRGNAIVVGATWKGSATLSVSDDQGDVYSNAGVAFDSTDDQSTGIAAAFHVFAGARQLRVCFSADPGGWVQPMASELSNVVGVHGAAGASGSGSSASVSLTPAGDVPYQVVYTPGGYPSSFTAGTGGSLLSADLLDGWAGQYGATTMTLGSGVHWVTSAVLLRTGTTGSVPSGMRIVHSAHFNLPVSPGGVSGGLAVPSPTPIEFPSSGNLLVAATGGGCGCQSPATISGISDSQLNSWTLAKGLLSNDIHTQLFFSGNAVPSNTLALSLSWAGNAPDDSTAILYDVLGASSTPLDIAQGSSGQQNGGNIVLPTLNVAGAGELVILVAPFDFDTAGGLTGGLLDTMTTSGMNESGPWPVDENNGWGHAWSTSTSVQLQWQPLFTDIEFGNWASTAAAFRSAP